MQMRNTKTVIAVVALALLAAAGFTGVAAADAPSEDLADEIYVDDPDPIEGPTLSISDAVFGSGIAYDFIIPQPDPPLSYDY